MTLGKSEPGQVLSRSGLWGHPWHGLVKNATLTLSNGETRPSLQPTGTRHWEKTAAHLLARPGLPAVVRDEAQQTADNAAGRQWRNTALMSGENALLYNKELGVGRFVWIDQAGDRWLIDASALHGQTWTNETVPAFVTLTIRRFGAFGIEDAPRPFNVTIPALGQDSPDVYSRPDTVETEFVCSIYSIHPQGERVALMLHYAVRGRIGGGRWPERESGEAWPSGRHPCGWLELEMTGSGEGPAAQISVLANRLETLGGSGAYSELITGNDRLLNFYSSGTYTESTSPDYDPLWPGCSGHRIRASDITTSDDVPPGYSPSSQVFQFDSCFVVERENQDLSYQFGGMWFAVWYADNGQRRVLTIDLAWSRQDVCSVSGLGETGTSRTRVDISAGDGTCEQESTILDHHDITMRTDITSDETARIAMKLDGTEVDAAEFAYAGVGSDVCRVFSEGESTALKFQRTVSNSPQLSGEGVEEIAGSGGSFQQVITEAGAAGYAAGTVWSQSLLWPGDVEPGKRALDLYIRAPSLWGTDGTAGRFDVAIASVRYGHAAVGWLRAHEYRTGQPVDFSRYGDIMTLAGLKTAAAWSVVSASEIFTLGPPEDVYVAWEPTTHDVALDTSPVCWV